MRDFAATVLDLAAIQLDEPFPGTSLVPLWSSDPSTVEVSPLLTELEQGLRVSLRDRNSGGRLKGLIDGSLYYILNGDGSEELFDLRTPVFEETNLINEPEWLESAERLRQAAKSLPKG